MDYHVFKKPVKGRSGRQIHRWYYYWTGPDGSQIQRVCKGCKNRSDADNYIRTLPPPTGAAPPIAPARQRSFPPSGCPADVFIIITSNPSRGRLTAFFTVR
jgi:hypothetical protein